MLSIVYTGPALSKTKHECMYRKETLVFPWGEECLNRTLLSTSTVTYYMERH